MFIHYRTQGLFLVKEDRGEADQLFTIYTKDFGRLEILGKAIRKVTSKLRAGANIFYLSEIEFIQGKAHKTLTDAILINKFGDIRRDSSKSRVAYKISEIFNDLVKNQEPDEKIWHLLIESFNRLNTSYKLQVTNYKIYYYFFWNLIKILGYQPELYNCSICEKRLLPEKIYFSPKGGGVICQNCSQKKPAKNSSILAGPPQSKGLGGEIQPETIKILRVILGKDWLFFKKIKITPQNQKELIIISEYFFSYIKKSIS